jgi:hypothetical protein
VRTVALGRAERIRKALRQGDVFARFDAHHSSDENRGPVGYVK